MATGGYDSICAIDKGKVMQLGRKMKASNAAIKQVWDKVVKFEMSRLSARSNKRLLHVGRGTEALH